MTDPTISKLLKVSAVITTLMCGLTMWYVFSGLAFENEDYGFSTTTVSFDRDTINMNTIKYGNEYKVKYKITNTGEAPLIILNIRSSCGCAKVEWEEEPISPGSTEEINVTFKPNSLGEFVKNLEIHCNTDERMINLKLKGKVVE